jgi:hypothetical protein
VSVNQNRSNELLLLAKASRDASLTYRINSAYSVEVTVRMRLGLPFYTFVFWRETQQSMMEMSRCGHPEKEALDFLALIPVQGNFPLWGKVDIQSDGKKRGLVVLGPSELYDEVMDGDDDIPF